MGNFQIQLQQLSDKQLGDLRKYLSAQGRNLDSIIEAHLKILLNGFEAELSDIGQCPNCMLNHEKQNRLKGLPIVDAEKKGFVQIDNDATRDFFRQSETYYVLCIHCGWWGWPDRSHLESWNKWD